MVASYSTVVASYSTVVAKAVLYGFYGHLFFLLIFMASVLHGTILMIINVEIASF